MTGVPCQAELPIGRAAERLVIGPKLAGPRLPPPPPRRGPREGGESRDFREPVRKDINKTNPRQHGEGPRPLQRNRTQSLSRPTPPGEHRCRRPDPAGAWAEGRAGRGAEEGRRPRKQQRWGSGPGRRGAGAGTRAESGGARAAGYRLPVTGAPAPSPTPGPGRLYKSAGRRWKGPPSGRQARSGVGSAGRTPCRAARPFTAAAEPGVVAAGNRPVREASGWEGPGKGGEARLAGEEEREGGV